MLSFILVAITFIINDMKSKIMPKANAKGRSPLDVSSAMVVVITRVT